VVVTAAIGAGSHGDYVARLRHLVVDLAQSRRHFVGERAGDDHHIALAACAKPGTKSSVPMAIRGAQRLEIAPDCTVESPGCGTRLQNRDAIRDQTSLRDANFAD
jgi:hypothetical protein